MESTTRFEFPLEKFGKDLKTAHVSIVLAELSTSEDKAALTKIAKGAKLAIEIGSFTGGTAHAILSGMDGSLICIDHFSGTKTVEKVEYTESVPSWMAYMCLHVRLHEFAGRYSVYTANSNVVAVRTRPELADFIFLDAAHSYNKVKHDIDLWWPILKPGGIFAGHDFDKELKDWSLAELGKHKTKERIKPGYHPGVVLAVREAFEDFELAESENSTIWWTRKGTPGDVSATMD